MDITTFLAALCAYLIVFPMSRQIAKCPVLATYVAQRSVDRPLLRRSLPFSPTELAPATMLRIDMAFRDCDTATFSPALLSQKTRTAGGTRFFDGA